MARENIAKMKCEVCKTVNYFTTRNKKKLKEKLTANKHCPKCRKHTVHKETKQAIFNFKFTIFNQYLIF